MGSTRLGLVSLGRSTERGTPYESLFCDDTLAVLSISQEHPNRSPRTSVIPRTSFFAVWHRGGFRLKPAVARLSLRTATKWTNQTLHERPFEALRAEHVPAGGNPGVHRVVDQADRTDVIYALNMIVLRRIIHGIHGRARGSRHYTCVFG